MRLSSGEMVDVDDVDAFDADTDEDGVHIKTCEFDSEKQVEWIDVLTPGMPLDAELQPATVEVYGYRQPTEEPTFSKEPREYRNIAPLARGRTQYDCPQLQQALRQAADREIGDAIPYPDVKCAPHPELPVKFTLEWDREYTIKRIVLYNDSGFKQNEVNWTVSLYKDWAATSATYLQQVTWAPNFHDLNPEGIDGIKKMELSVNTLRGAGWPTEIMVYAVPTTPPTPTPTPTLAQQ